MSETFANLLLSNIEERIITLTEIERAVFTKRYALSKKHYDIFSLYSISMIYSIWEGFVQTAFNNFIDEINKTEHNLFNFNSESLTFYIESTHRQFYEYPSKSNGKRKFYENLDSFFKKENHLLPRMVNTQSNVGFNVLNKLLQTFNITKFDSFWGNYIHPKPNLSDTLDSLLRIRNAVAHGGDVSSENINQDEFIKYKNLIIDLMYEILNKMQIAINEKSYLIKL